MHSITINILPEPFKPLPVIFNTASAYFIQPTMEYKKGKQDFHQILIVVDGKGTLYCEDETHELKKGCAFFTAMNTESKYVDDGSLVTAFLTVKGDCISEIAKHFDIEKFAFFESVDVVKYTSLIEQIINEYYKTKNEAVLSALSYSFYVSFFENRKEALRDSLDKTLLYIEKNFYKKISLGELAEINDTSVSKLCHDFKEKYGFTVFQHILNLRLNYAKNLLNSAPNIKIKDVAVSCGFEDVSYFCRAYKNKFGISPGESK